MEWKGKEERDREMTLAETELFVFPFEPVDLSFKN